MSRDMRDQVSEALSREEGVHDISGIIDEIREQYGEMEVDSVPAQQFWKIVDKHKRG